MYHDESKRIKALLIMKEEESIATAQPIVASRLLKLCTLKVDLPGLRMGERLLKLAFQYCTGNQFFETYLPHLRRGEDALINLLADYGFVKMGTKENGEEVYLKRLTPRKEYIAAIEVARRYYPSFRDTPNVTKYIVPIQPEYHERLFPDYRRRQRRITEYSEINVQGNTIRKAYLSHSRIRGLRPGDLLLFYRSNDQMAVTSLGVVEDTMHTSSADKVVEFVGNRTVYSIAEIEGMTKKQVLVILFRHHLNFPRPIDLEHMTRNGIVRSAPQSITMIPHVRYAALKKGGGLDERFTVS